MSRFKRTQISYYQFHEDWRKQKNREEGNFNFSEWVRQKIEEEAGNAPAHL